MAITEKQTTDPLVSVIIPSYNAVSTLPRTVECLLDQTYRNLEIIIVNDGSSDGTAQLAGSYAAQYTQVKVVTHEKNAGLLKARLTGSDAAGGEFIAFLDADDTVSIDYYRNMVAIAVENDSSMVIGEVVLEDAMTGNRSIYGLANDLPFQSLQGKTAFASFMEQRGLNHNWHVAWNKLIRRDLWQEARPHYDMITNHLVMGEDIALSVPLWYYAKRVDRSATSYNFYLRGHEEASTSLEALTYKKAKKNVADLKTVFDFFEAFLSVTNSFPKYTAWFTDWKLYFSHMWFMNSDSPSLTQGEKDDINAILHDIADYTTNRPDLNYHMYDISLPWDDGLEAVKRSIVDPTVRVISFDIFDTLISRPFGIPSDLFHFIEAEFRAVCPDFTVLDFHDVRVNAEVAARQKHSDLEDITLDHIYAAMEEVYGISKKASRHLSRFELKLEKQFIRRRRTAFELFTLAKYLKKTVVLTTDMYLPREVIVSMLTKTGYVGWDELSISSELNLTKHNGTIFSFLAKKLKVQPQAILHIGDSEHADVHMAQKSGYRTAHFPDAMTALLTRGGGDAIYGKIGDNVNGSVGKDYYGIRVMLSVVAGKYFDNPFTSCLPGTIFSARPSYIGYFALGMHLYSLADWLKQATEQYDNVVFLARDGYVPMQAYDILTRNMPRVPKLHYIPTSRKAILPLSIISPQQDMHHLHRFLNMGRQTVGDALRILAPILKDEAIKKVLAKNKLDNKTVLGQMPYHHLSLALQELVDDEKIRVLQAAFKSAYGGAFSGRAAVFDVGYSAKPEQVLSRVFNKPIDTFFIHSDAEGAKRSLPADKVHLHTFYNYKPSLSSEIRELFISELAPSCTGYTVDDAGHLTVQYDKKYTISYYEKFVLTAIHDNALAFIQDLRDIFGEYLSELSFSNQYASLPHEIITNRETGADKDIFAPFVFEDDMGAGVIRNIATQHLQPSNLSLADVLNGRSKTTKALAYFLVDRGQFVGKVKQKVKNRKDRHPVVYVTLKSTWNVARRLKRAVKKQ